jgi:hypothetical protein
MNKIFGMILLMSITALNVLAEMPVTNVTPQNMKGSDISFSLSVTKRYGDTYRVNLAILPNDNKKIHTSQPGLYLHVGDKNLGLVAFFSEENKDGQPTSYWCDLDKSCLDSSIITVCSYPDKPIDNMELCAQSMEYNFRLKNFTKE